MYDSTERCRDRVKKNLFANVSSGHGGHGPERFKRKYSREYMMCVESTATCGRKAIGGSSASVIGRLVVPTKHEPLPVEKQLPLPRH
jgi:hypothetical protein